MPRKTVVFSLVYIAFVVFCFFYVKSILKTESLFPRDTTKPKVEKTWDVSAKLIVSIGTKILNFETKVKNTDSIMNFLEELRGEKGFVFEKIDYTHGIEISSVFNVNAPSGYKWSVFLNDLDITTAISTTRLVDKAVYEIRLAAK